MQTAPKPLRRAPVSKPADSRYVSLFSDANNKADITFSDGHKGLLPKSTITNDTSRLNYGTRVD